MGDLHFRESNLTDHEGNIERTIKPINSSYNIKFDTTKHQNKKQGSGDHGDSSFKDVKKLNDLFSVKFIPTPPKRKWAVSYNNRNYIKSQLSEDILEHFLEKKKHENASAKKVWKNKDGVY